MKPTKKNGEPKQKSVLLRLPLTLVQKYQQTAYKASAAQGKRVTRQHLMHCALSEWLKATFE